MAKVNSMLNNIDVIKICSHMGTTLHKRLSKASTFLVWDVNEKTLTICENPRQR